MTAPPAPQWRPVPALGAAALAAGVVVLLGLIGDRPAAPAILAIAPLPFVAASWRFLWGWGALPAALALGAAGAGLLARRHDDPWDLPWLRVLGVEAVLAAGLALAAAALGPAQPDAEGPGGLIGWALVTASDLALGRTLGVLAWLGAGILGVLAAFRIGAQRIAAGLDDLADALALAHAAGAAQGGNAAHERSASSRALRQPPGTVARVPSTGEQSPLAPAGRAATAASSPPASTAGVKPTSTAGTKPVPTATPVPAASAASKPASPGATRPASTGVSKPEPGSSRPSTIAPVKPVASTAAGSPSAAAAPGTSDKPAASSGSTARPRPSSRSASGSPHIPLSTAAAPPGRRVRAALLPDPAVLDAEAPAGKPIDDAAIQAMAQTIAQTLAGFGAPGDVTDIERGPTFTRFGVRPGFVERGGQRLRVKVSRIAALKHDLALALAAPAIRIEAPIPGRALVGIEVPNATTGPVRLRGILESPTFKKAQRKNGLALALGRDVSGAPVVADLAGMPHLLIAGATGSGKSVCLNVLMASLLFQNTPDTLRMIVIDPKRVEMGRYARLPHLVATVVTDALEAVGALRWAAAEMDERYQRFAARGARDRAAFNARSPAGEAPVPALVIVIDELADLMLTAPVEVEPLLTRLAQLGRATGIHLVVATQRPSTDVLTGLIKANFPARIAFAVASGIDSRVVLDHTGAEALLGRGDMLFQPPDAPHPRRLQGAWVTDPEVDACVDFWHRSHWPPPGRLPPWEDLVPSGDPDADLYARAEVLAQEDPHLNASVLQRRLRVGFPKARQLFARLVEDGWVAERGRGSSADDGGGDGGPRPRDLDWVDSEFDG